MKILAMVVDITPDNVFQAHYFRFEIDQTYLPHLIRDCRTVLQHCPIKGLP